MKKTFLMLAVAAGVLCSCGEKKAEGSADSTGAKTEEKSESKEITLKEYKGDILGFTIQAPEGAKELANNDMMWTYSLVLPDGMNEINVAVVKFGEIASLEDAVKNTAFGEEPKIKDKKEVNGGYLVVKEPQGTLIQETWFFTKSKDGAIGVKCTTPPNQQALAEKIATSLKSTK
jgi:hypothetical protein